MLPLGMLSEGEQAEIIQWHKKQVRKKSSEASSATESKHKNQLEAIGLRPGQKIVMLSNGGTGPVLLKFGETRLAVGRSVSMKIMVKP